MSVNAFSGIILNNVQADHAFAKKILTVRKVFFTFCHWPNIILYFVVAGPSERCWSLTEPRGRSRCSRRGQDPGASINNVWLHIVLRNLGIFRNLSRSFAQTLF